MCNLFNKKKETIQQKIYSINFPSTLLRTYNENHVKDDAYKYLFALKNSQKLLMAQKKIKNLQPGSKINIKLMEKQTMTLTSLKNKN